MFYLLVFAGGMIAGRNWDAVKKAVAPLASAASERFDSLYARTARSVARNVEDLEDRRVEREHRASQLVD